MRKIYFTILTAIILVCLSVPLKAQIQVSFNIGSQPVWGPVGYDEVEYYYLPDIEGYYYVPQHTFYFYDRGNWISYSSLPSRYSNYDLYRSYKVVINEREPWHNHKTYKTKYASYKGRHDQLIIRDSRDSKYFVNKNHPQHSKWQNEQKHEKSQIKGNNNSNGKERGNVSGNKSGSGKKNGNGNGKGKK